MELLKEILSVRSVRFALYFSLFWFTMFGISSVANAYTGLVQNDVPEFTIYSAGSGYPSPAYELQNGANGVWFPCDDDSCVGINLGNIQAGKLIVAISYLEGWHRFKSGGSGNDCVGITQSQCTAIRGNNYVLGWTDGLVWYSDFQEPVIHIDVFGSTTPASIISSVTQGVQSTTEPIIPVAGTLVGIPLAFVIGRKLVQFIIMSV